MTDLLQMENPQILAETGVGYRENCRFLTFIRRISETVQDIGPSCYWPLKGICIRVFDWCQNR